MIPIAAPPVQKAPGNPQDHLRKLLADPEGAYATTLVTILIDTYGTEALTWAPETLQLQFYDDFGVELPKANLDKLMAAVTILTTDYFYANLPRFLVLCSTLSGDQTDPSQVQVADALECAWGITEAMLLSPPEEAEPFCDDIRHYLTAVLKDEGYIRPPDVMRIALDADFASQVQYDFAEDPTMFAAINQVQSSKTDEATAMLRENLQDLLAQLASLPLKTGSVKQLLARLPQDLRPRA